MLPEFICRLTDIVEEVAFVDALPVGMVDIVALPVDNDVLGPDILVVLLVGILKEGIERVHAGIQFLHMIIEAVFVDDEDSSLYRLIGSEQPTLIVGVRHILQDSDGKRDDHQGKDADHHDIDDQHAP